MASFSGENLSCVRGERLVLEGIDFSLSEGDALVLTGPNGAGKSTMLRLMAGLMRPSEGALRWDGQSIVDDPSAHNARIAYVGHADAVKSALSVYENVAFWSSISGSGGRSPDVALDALGIPHLSELPARFLSAGQRRRVNLCRMLTSPAKVWLLDEPTTALDASASDMLGELIAAHRANSGMVIVSTHTDLGLSDAKNLTLGGGA